MNSNSHDCIIPSSLLVYQTASPSWKLVRDSHRPYPQTQICRLKRSVKSGRDLTRYPARPRWRNGVMKFTIDRYG